MERKRRKDETAARNLPKSGACASARCITFVTGTPRGDPRQPVDILPESVGEKASTVLFMPLMECGRPVSSPSTRIGGKSSWNRSGRFFTTSNGEETEFANLTPFIQ
ncbi:hypothetical protein AVEN_174598-1 [Araneus ventricosus]|uniref:Uncharacterized protein n=1 Tax=Araneus ventricosus TaxID=182803 RepID=A0A4Y2MUS2_ARAVE|nr:hypothetical protein AVEN_174598-1 [Araneus ventricosus]